MATISSSRHDTHATTATGGWSTKRIATTALFCAVAAIATIGSSVGIVFHMFKVHGTPTALS